jgi:two-component system, NtrC family, response regulator AtoC
VMARGDTIDGQWLPKVTAATVGASSAAPAAAAAAVSAPAPAPASASTLTPAGTTAPLLDVEVMPPPMPECSGPAPSATEPAGDSVTVPIGSSMEQAERALIVATLKHFNFQKERTAAALGISLKTLYNRLRDYQADESSSVLP